MTGVVLSNYGHFQNNIVLENLAYQIALVARQAQSYGLDTRTSVIGGANFNHAYGLHFYGPTDPLFTNRFLFYTDLSASSKLSYDSNIPGETVELFRIQTGYSVLKYCGIYTSGGTQLQDCTTDTSSPTRPSYLDIVFKRPNPEAQFDLGTGRKYQQVEVYIQSNVTKGYYIVQVYNTGQISTVAKP